MTEREKAFIIGTLIGDALGLPAYRKPHHIIRMYFKGIKDYTDEYYSTASPTGLRKGQNSKSVLELLNQLANNNIIADWSTLFFQITESQRLIGFFQSIAIHQKLDFALVDNKIIGEHATKIKDALPMFPSELVVHFNEAMIESDAIDFAIAMLFRNHDQFDTTVLSTVNMGGLTTLTGAIVGGAMGLLHGMHQIPVHWIEKLEFSEEILKRLQLDVKD